MMPPIIRKGYLQVGGWIYQPEQFSASHEKSRGISSQRQLFFIGEMFHIFVAHAGAVAVTIEFLESKSRFSVLGNAGYHISMTDKNQFRFVPMCL